MFSDVSRALESFQPLPSASELEEILKAKVSSLKLGDRGRGKGCVSFGRASMVWWESILDWKS